MICDTYLSVSTPVQMAARGAHRGRARHPRADSAARIASNLATLERMLGAGSSISLLAPEGGWSVVLRVPATESEEALVLRLLHDAHVLVHPGFFFDFADEAFVVVSLLPEPAVFEEAIGASCSLAGGRPRMMTRHAGVMLPLFSATSSRSWGIGECRTSCRCPAGWRPPVSIG